MDNIAKLLWLKHNDLNVFLWFRYMSDNWKFILKFWIEETFKRNMQSHKCKVLGNNMNHSLKTCYLLYIQNVTLAMETSHFLPTLLDFFDQHHMYFEPNMIPYIINTDL